MRAVKKLQFLQNFFLNPLFKAASEASREKKITLRFKAASKASRKNFLPPPFKAASEASREKFYLPSVLRRQAKRAKIKKSARNFAEFSTKKKLRGISRNFFRDAAKFRAKSEIPRKKQKKEKFEFYAYLKSHSQKNIFLNIFWFHLNRHFFQKSKKINIFSDG